MAVNVPQRVFSDGVTNRFAVYRVFGITATDTIQVARDLASRSPPGRCPPLTGSGGCYTGSWVRGDTVPASVPAAASELWRYLS